jgi:hypothetical protein
MTMLRDDSLHGTQWRPATKREQSLAEGVMDA